MGYQTQYSLEVYWESKGQLVEPTDEQVETIILATLSDSNACSALNNDGTTNQAIKWYSHEKDIAEVSKRFGGFVLKLTGVGEDADDQWIKYFKDGQVQVCKVQLMFPPFDPKQFT